MQLVKIVVVVLIAVVVTAAACFWYMDAKQTALLTEIDANIQETRSTLHMLAEQVDNGEVDTVVGDIINDCRDRVEFESLLGQLHLLEGAQLERAKQLFDTCGDYYSVRHAFMVSRVEREHSALLASINIYESISGNSRYTELREAWDRIIELLNEKNELFEEQVAIQGKIIDALIAGKRPNDDEIQEMLGRARDIVELVGVADTKVDAQRERAIELTLE